MINEIKNLVHPQETSNYIEKLISTILKFLTNTNNNSKVCDKSIRLFSLSTQQVLVKQKLRLMDIDNVDSHPHFPMTIHYTFKIQNMDSAKTRNN